MPLRGWVKKLYKEKQMERKGMFIEQTVKPLDTSIATIHAIVTKRLYSYASNLKDACELAGSDQFKTLYDAAYAVQYRKEFERREARNKLIGLTEGVKS